MSWQAQGWAIEMGKRYELDPGHRWLLTILANYADPEGNDIYPSMETLAADTGLSVMSIRRYIKHLIACQLMEYGNQSAVLKFKAGHRPKVYRLTMTKATFEGAHGETSHGETSQMTSLRGLNRGNTVVPKPVNPKENLCRDCSRSRPVTDLSASGICADCLGIGPNAAAEGAAYREQLRLRRLAHAVGSMP